MVQETEKKSAMEIKDIENVSREVEEFKNIVIIQLKLISACHRVESQQKPPKISWVSCQESGTLL
jgi:hypothetical protein